MTSIETRTSQVSFFGRLADDLTRKVLSPADMLVALENGGPRAMRKDDGYFVFADLMPSTTDYRIRMGGRGYQGRTIAKALPTNLPVEVMLAGEDELYVSIAEVVPSQNQLTFDKIPLVPVIETGAAVIGQDGFTARLQEPIEGQKVAFAVLTTVSGLAAGQLLRIVRSNNLLLRPGPYYAFSDATTVLAVKIVGDEPERPTIDGAAIAISKINGRASTSTDVSGLNLNLFSLGDDSTGALVLDDDDKLTTANERGDAAFYFGFAQQIANVELTVTKPQYQTTTVAIEIVMNRRNSQSIVLTRE